MLCSSSNLGRPINIAAWLSQIPDDICLEHIHRADLDRNVEKSLNKRKRRPLLVSPPPSHPGPSFSSSDGDEALPLNMADTPSGKRQKRHHQTAPGSPTDQPLSQDPDATPTQGRQAPGIYTASLGTQTPTASDHESSLSSVSGQSSPTKRLAAVSLGNAPFDTKEYNSSVQRPPAGPAFDMFEKMEYLDNNEGLLPEAMRPVFLEYTKNRKVSRIGNAAFDNSGQRDALGPTPPIDHVLDLVHEAMRCQELVHTEHTWNCSVHFPLLKLALHGADGRKRQLVDFDSCTHAKPLAAYRSKSGSSTTHMVDFCINLCPRQAGSHHAPAVEAIDVLRTELTDNSINHTGHNPLLRDPISVSIETKRPDEGGQKQALQMGVWQTAQWRHLEKLVQMRLAANGEPPQTRQERCHEVLGQLDYLPAVLVRGHDWYFAATMREGHKKILWREVSMGSTRNVLGIYRIIYAIQLLAEYSRDHFWPWYLRAVLGISTAGDANMATTSDENMTMTSDTDITADADQSIGADG
ncbi:hypothetical protein CGCF415_v015119 [Colletotrichum fructicola]|nr:hypothetical protein CGCF415_v015119 [Colletotrichum fructicola]KAF4923308.1 hypothetical protein CGCF245_v014994 [Colletotrichum fructicola]KAF5482883.1 hypothetical protein CGCF413_v015553 [Colletotrichum fructicola]